MSREPGVNTKIAVLSFAHGHAIGYLQYLLGRDDVDVIAADPDGEAAPDAAPRGAAFAKQYGLDHYVDSYREALDWRPDGVIICAENTRHRALAERAAAAGAHILCEKPLATSVVDAAAMIAAAKSAGVFVMTAFPVRFSPAFARLKAAADAGELGRILSISGTNNGKIPTADRSWFTEPGLSGGGSLVDHLVHCADLLDALLGEPATIVRATANSILYREAAGPVETGGIVSITYRSGIIATLDCSWSQPATAPTWGGLTLHVAGTNGSIHISPFAEHVGGYDGSGAVWLPSGADLDAAMIDEFIRGIRRGYAPQPDGSVGMRTVQLVEAAQKSAVTGQPVRL